MATPFTIAIPESVLEDLKTRLSRIRWPDQVAAYEWRQGSELSYTQTLAEYWRESYDWRRQEQALNTLNHFKTVVDGQELHFVHERSPHENARPLLIQHGWPGSFYEFFKIIPMLTHPEEHGGTAEDAFHVIAPSLPGYVFSPPAREPGMTTRRIGTLMHGLMQSLGYSRFGTQGGDWGAVVTSWLAFDHPDSVSGVHLNMQGIRAKTSGGPPLSNEEKAFLLEARNRFQEDMGYFSIQATRPQTLGYGLTDSPVGLLAWLAEKFRAWTDCKGDMENSLTRDEFLTNVMLYWVTGCIAESTRLYYEHFHSGDDVLPGGSRIDTPTGFAHFPGELFHPPRHWVERAYNIVHWTEMDHGGHFAAMEEPALLAGDIRAFFGSIE